jgi:hypothetical protein
MFTPVGAAAGTTGAAAYFGKRLVRGLTSAFVSNRAAEWADKKIISKKIRAEEKRDDATNRMRSEFAGFGDSFTLEKLQEIQDRHEQTLKKYESDQRKKILMKAAVMMATGVGVAAAWSFTEQAAFGSPRPDTAHKGSAAEHPKQAGQTGEPGTEHQESSARIRQDQQETKTSKNPYSEDQAKTQSQETKANEAVGQEQTPEPQNPETGAQDHPQPSPEDLRGNNPESLGKYEDVARKGDSVWKMAERQLEKNYGEEFGKLNQAQKTYIVDAIRRKMESEGVDKFGLKGLDSLQEQQKLDFSKVLDDEEWMKEKFGRANGLGEKEIENIIRNNRINAGITENPTPPQEEIELQRSEASDTLMTNTDQAAQIPPPPEIPYEPEIDQIESNIPVGQPEPPELPHPLGVPPLPHPFVHDTFEAAHIPSIEIDYASHLGLSEQQYLPLRGINTDEFLKQVPTRMDLESNPDMLSALEGGRLTAPLHIGDKIQHITLTRGHTDLAERIFMSMPTREMRKMTISQAIELLSKAGR